MDSMINHIAAGSLSLCSACLVSGCKVKTTLDGDDTGNVDIISSVIMKGLFESFAATTLKVLNYKNK